MKTCLILLTVFATIGLFATVNALGTDLKAGDPAPDFELKGSDGKTYKLSEIDKPVVIAWFPKAFTGG